MVFDRIEKLKSEYTDRQVVVDDRRPELTRFRGLTGVVKTVNMSGRALVQFEGRNNIGWYDIDVDFLKVIDVTAVRKEVAAATPEPLAKGPTELKKTRSDQPPSKPPAAGRAVQDILRAARAGAGTAPSESEQASPPTAAPEALAPKAGLKKSTAEILAAARANRPAVEKPGTPAAESKPAEPRPAAGKQLSTAEILAAARAAKPVAAKPAEPVVEAKPAEPRPAAGKQLSTAEILAAARAAKPVAAKPAATDDAHPLSDD